MDRPGSVSPLAQGRGLKHLLPMRAPLPADVAPRAGAWIETSQGAFDKSCRFVAPRAGAWIETRPTQAHVGWTASPLAQGRGLKHGANTYGVDKCSMSPLAQGRGLKRRHLQPLHRLHRSPLAQGRGLKRDLNWDRGPVLLSPLAQGRGLKPMSGLRWI